MELFGTSFGLGAPEKNYQKTKGSVNEKVWELWMYIMTAIRQKGITQT